MYIDLIIECPKGFTPIIGEYLKKGLSKYVTFDEDKKPTGLGNGINKFYPTVPTFETPGLVYLRLKEEIYEELVAKDFKSFNILIDCKATGETTVVNEVSITKSIYQKIQEDKEAYEIYCKYSKYEEEFLKDEDGEIIKNEYGENVKDPRFGTIKKIGQFA